MVERDFAELFATFDDSARIWTFAFDRPLSAEFSAKLAEFLTIWRAHGNSVPSEVGVLYDRFVLVVAQPEVLSGCGIDSMFSAVKNLARDDGAELLPSGTIFFESEGKIVHAERPAFFEIAKAQSVSPATRVVDPSIQTLGDFRAGKWILPIQNSWHAKLFSIGVAPR